MFCVLLCVLISHSHISIFSTEKQEARGKLTRMDTVMKFDHASEAMRRYESTGVVTHISEKDEGTTDNDPDDGMLLSVTVTLYG